MTETMIFISETYMGRILSAWEQSSQGPTCKFNLNLKLFIY